MPLLESDIMSGMILLEWNNVTIADLGMLRRHYETMKRKKNLIPYLAIIHVRDMLITPSERYGGLN